MLFTSSAYSRSTTPSAGAATTTMAARRASGRVDSVCISAYSIIGHGGNRDLIREGGGIPMRRPRLTVSRLMLLVAFVAIGIEATRLARLSMRYASQADEHHRDAVRNQADLAMVRSSKTVDYYGMDGKEFLTEYLADSHRYNMNLYSKYVKASRTPWRALLPDPSAPSPFPPARPVTDLLDIPLLDPLPEFPTTEG